MKNADKKIKKFLQQQVEIRLSRDTNLKQTLSIAQLLELANQKEQGGDPITAAFLLRQAIETEQSSLCLEALLTFYVRQSWIPEAIVLIETVNPDRLNYLPVRYLVARCYREMGFVEQAISSYLAFLKKKPNSSLVWDEIGLCYTAIGNKSKAKSCYKRSISVNRFEAGPYRNITELLDKEEYDDYLEETSRLLNSNRITDKERVQIYFGRARVYEKSKQYELEIDALANGNQIKWQQRDEDPEVERKRDLLYIEELGKVWDQYDSKNYRKTESKPIILCCMPRSGSSLLEMIISKSNLVTQTAEADLVWHAVRQMRHIGVAPQSPLSVLEENTANLFLESYNKVTSWFRVDTPFFSNKSIGNFVELGFIKKLIPDARFIYLKRNSLDVCISCYQNLFSEGHSYIYSLEETAKQIVHYEKIMTGWQKQFPDDILTINYEDLVAQPDAETAKLFSFIGLSNPQHIEDNVSHTVSTVSAWQVRAPINTRSVEKWQNYRSCLGDAAKILGVPLI